MADIIITNLSAKNDKAKMKDYSSDIGTFKGTQTNEAPVKYLVKYLEEKNKRAEKILAVTTNEADKAFDNLQNIIGSYCNENGYDVPEIKKVRFTNIAETLKEIVSCTSKGDKVYMDSTGGFRDAVVTVLMTMRVLEFSGVELEKIVYSDNFQSKVRDVTDTYKLYDLINGVNSFASYGNSDELERYFKTSSNDSIKKLVDVMIRFSENITLCKTKCLDDDLKKLNECLNRLSDTSETDTDSVLFGTLADLIRRKFYISDNKNTIELPGIVKWCVDNKLIQQAVTIYVERMPEYFYKKEFYTVSDSILNECVNSRSNFDWQYELFYNKFMRMESSKSDKATILPIDEIINKDMDSLTKNIIIECKSTEALKYKVKNLGKLIKKGSEHEKAMNEFFKLKDAMYDKNGKRRKLNELNEAKKKYPRFESVIDNINSNTAEGFISYIINSGKIRRMLCGIEEPVSKSSESLAVRIEVIKNLDDYTRDSKRYRVMTTVPDMQKIMTDYIYIKNFFRNKMNHASDDGNVDEVLCEYLESKNYNTSDDISVKEIQDIMKGIIEHIEKIKI